MTALEISVIWGPSVVVGLLAFGLACDLGKKLLLRGWRFGAGYLLAIATFIVSFALITAGLFVIAIPFLGLRPVHGWGVNAYAVPTLIFLRAIYVHAAALFFVYLYLKLVTPQAEPKRDGLTL